ncbi:MAG: geranylgeranyl reductase family protein [Candidatus Lokiarchaeota archaeon]|nr:geranylgeranyl reductase family protein [Candidatus Lokiarchaeota archaeon]
MVQLKKGFISPLSQVVPLKADVVVVGAGPAGLITAREVARSGYDVLVLEEHPRIGVPDHCAGLLSTTGLNSLGLAPPHYVIQNNVNGARMYAPNGSKLTISRGRREALVVDRRAFDSWLAERAENSGAMILTNTKAIDATLHEGNHSIVSCRENGKAREIKARIIVNAEGAIGRFSGAVGLPTVKQSSKLPAFQYEFRNVNLDSEHVEMYYGRRLAPGFFAWCIPLGKDRARVGMAARSHVRKRLTWAIQHHPILSNRIGEGTIDRKMGGVVLVGTPISRTYDDRILVVGDAAGMVKATTGGGVIMGGKAAKIAGKVIVGALSKEETSAQYLKRYEYFWKKQLLKDFFAMYAAQKMISLLSNQGLNFLFRKVNEYGLIDTIEQHGDMDRQSKVITQLLKNPRIALRLFGVIRYIQPFY